MVIVGFVDIYEMRKCILLKGKSSIERVQQETSCPQVEHSITALSFPEVVMKYHAKPFAKVIDPDKDILFA